MLNFLDNHANVILLILISYTLSLHYSTYHSYREINIIDSGSKCWRLVKINECYSSGSKCTGEGAHQPAPALASSMQAGFSTTCQKLTSNLTAMITMAITRTIRITFSPRRTEIFAAHHPPVAFPPARTRPSVQSMFPVTPKTIIAGMV